MLYLAHLWIKFRGGYSELWRRLRQPKVVHSGVPAFVQQDEDLQLMRNAGWIP